MSIWITLHDWGMLFLYPLVTAVILIATLAAATNPIYRRAFIFMAISGALSLFCCLVTLFFRLYLALHLTILPVEMRRMILALHDLAEIASMPLYLIGFLTLTYRVYTQTSQTKVS
jgi:hypothetical protein